MSLPNHFLAIVEIVPSANEALIASLNISLRSSSSFLKAPPTHAPKGPPPIDGETDVRLPPSFFDM